MTSDTYLQRAELCFALLALDRRHTRPVVEKMVWLWLLYWAAVPA